MSRRCRMGRKRLSRRRFWGWGTSRPATNQPSCSSQNLLTAGIGFFERFLDQLHFQRNRSNGRISHHLRTFRWLPEILPRFRISWPSLAFPHAGDPCTSRILSCGKVGSHSLDFLQYCKKSNANLYSIEKTKTNGLSIRRWHWLSNVCELHPFRHLVRTHLNYFHLLMTGSTILRLNSTHMALAASSYLYLMWRCCYLIPRPQPHVSPHLPWHVYLDVWSHPVKISPR